MTLYRWRGEVGGYLDLEVIAESKDGVEHIFGQAVRAKCKQSGGTWAQDEIDSFKWDSIETLTSGATLDGEPWPVTL